MQCRRARVDGGAYFLTVNLAERRGFLLVEYTEVLRKVVGMVKERHPFSIDAMVIHVSRAADWPYSSIHRYIKAGIISNDRGSYGER